MKRIFLAAGIGLTVITAATAMTSGNYATAQDFAGTYQDTVPKKDTTEPEPKPEPVPDSTVSFNLHR